MFRVSDYPKGRKSNMTGQRIAVVSGGTVGIGRGIVDRLFADNYIIYTFIDPAL